VFGEGKGNISLFYIDLRNLAYLSLEVVLDMFDTELLLGFYSLTVEGDYDSVIGILDGIRDLQLREDLCFGVLNVMAMRKALDEYGEFQILKSREEWELARTGFLDNVDSRVVLYTENEMICGIEDLLDLVPEDNPLKKYYNGLLEI